MPTKNQTPAPATDAFESIDPAQLAQVAGGTSSNDQLTAMLTQITSSISQMSQNKSSGMDPTMMMMMMMMMGGGGGGGGGGYVAAAPGAVGAPPVVNVDTSVLGRGGWLGGGGGACGGGGCGSKKGW
ncbi:MAG TPA: hypothetical protein VGC42_02045 [Kofleriaceae bacterium]